MATNNAINTPTIIGVTRGGTGAGTFTANSVLLGNTTSAISALGAATNGQLIIGSTASSPVLATLTGGTGISITNGAGSITLNSVTGGMTWTTVTGSTQSMAVNNGYVANDNTGVTFTLPATAAVGDRVIVDGINSGGWIIGENSGQTIHFGTSDTTTTSGTLASTATYDSVSLRCVITNTDWLVEAAVGNLTVV